MNPKYNNAKSLILEALEEIPCTRGTTAQEYKKALEEIRKEVLDWFSASIDAAKDDIRRAEGD